MEQNSSLQDALQSWEEALEALVAKCDIASEHGTEDIDLVMANLQQAEEPFLSALNNGREYCSMRIQQIREQRAAFQSKAVDPDTFMEHNSLFKDSLQSYEEAQQAVMAECNTPSEQGTEGIDLVMANLIKKHELFHLASKHATELRNMRIQQIRDQQAELTKAMFPNTVYVILH